MMKTLYLLLLVIILSSCNATNKVVQKKETLFSSILKQEKIDSDWKVYSYQERNIRMAITNSKWRNLDNDSEFDFKYTPYSFGYNYGYYYNPKYYPCPVYTVGSSTAKNPKTLLDTRKNLMQNSITKTNYLPLQVNIANKPNSELNYFSYNFNYSSNIYSSESIGFDSRKWCPAYINNTNNVGSGRNNDGSGTNTGHINGGPLTGIPQIQPGPSVAPVNNF
jgi:hypothetical protein